MHKMILFRPDVSRLAEAVLLKAQYLANSETSVIFSRVVVNSITKYELLTPSLDSKVNVLMDREYQINFQSTQTRQHNPAIEFLLYSGQITFSGTLELPLVHK